MITAALISLGTMMIPIGFQLYGIYYLEPNHNRALMDLANICFLLGAIILFSVAYRAQKEDDKRDNNMHTLITEIKGLRKDLTSKANPDNGDE